MLRGAALRKRQAGMRFRESEKPRRGWPKGTPRTNKPLCSVACVKFELARLLRSGKTPKEAARLVGERLGVQVVEGAIERWRKSAYTSWA